MVTCGGMFKIVAEELARIPHSWRQRGFEWVYRLWQEPHTWKRYCLGLPAFGLRILAARWGLRRKQGPGTVKRRRRPAGFLSPRLARGKLLSRKGG